MSEWANIAGKLIQAGAPILGGALAGGVGSSVGALAGKLIADALGVDNNPDAVGQAFDRDPAGCQAQLQRAESNPMLPLLLEQEKNRALDIATQHELRMREANGAWWQSGWRPFCAFSLGVICLMVGITACAVTLLNGGKGLNELAMAVNLVVVTLGGVAGVTAWGRSQEKIAAAKG